jgi:hypothetical protein
MRIIRRGLTDRLDAFARSGHGLLTGAPGVGKTHSILELHEKWTTSNVPHLLIPVERLGSGTDAEVRDVLGIPGDLVDYVEAQMAVGLEPGVVVFDAFDAARSEATRERILSLVGRLIGRAVGRWTVLVSVRLYDASRSSAIRALFRERGSPSNVGPLSGVRCFEIPILSGDEVDEGISQIPGLADLLRTAKSEFRGLLHIPFNLWLLERIIASPGAPVSITGIASEVQLLGMYWQRRVAGLAHPDLAEHLLRRFVNELVRTYSLSARKDVVYTPDVTVAWDELRSAGVLEDVGTAHQRIAFSHNILFDYAVSVLLLDDDPHSLEAFVAADPARPFFLRPSITYLILRLWYDDRRSYWRSVWHTMSTQDQNLRLIGRIIPPAILVSESRDRSDWEPAFSAIDSHKPHAPEFVLRLFQALRATSMSSVELRAQICLDAAMRPNPEYLWDVVTIATEILEGGTSKEALEAVGEVGRRSLRWALAARGTSIGRWADRLGALWATPLVARTYSTNPAESNSLLMDVLKLVREPNVTIEYFSRLSDRVVDLAVQAPDLAVDVYSSVFGHSEESTQVTEFGSPILPLRSTRKQDFHMCGYLLAQKYGGFLKESPLRALEAGLEAVNATVIREDVLPYLRPGKSLEDLQQRARFLGAEVNFYEDASYIWGVSRHSDTEEILDKAIAYIETILNGTSDVTLTDALTVFAKHAKVAASWRQLLLLCARNSPGLAPFLHEFALSPDVQSGRLLYELAECVKASYQTWTTAQRRAFEESLLVLRNSGDPERVASWNERADRLVGVLPLQLLELPESRARRAELESAGEVPDNIPLSQITSSSKTFTNEDWLTERGVDIQEHANRELLDLQKEFEQRESGWRGSRVAAAEAVDIARIVGRAWGVIDAALEQADASVVAMVTTKVVAAASVIAKSEGPLDGETLDVARNALLRGATFKSTESDSTVEDEFKHAAWSPTPKTEAAQGLAWFTLVSRDAAILEAIEVLAFDPEPAVRYLVNAELFRLRWTANQEFWDIVDRVARNESNGTVRGGLLASLGRLPREDAGRVSGILQIIEARGLAPQDSEASGREWAHLLGTLALREQDTWAVACLTRLANDARDNSEILGLLAFDASSAITPEYLSDPQIAPITLRAVHWLRTVISGCGAAIGSLNASPQVREVEKDQVEATLRALYGVVDSIALRIYFNAREHKGGDGTGGPTIEYYRAVHPLVDDLIGVGRKDGAVLLAHTAHHIMEYLHLCIELDVRDVLRLAADVAETSSGTGYNLDSMAVREVVQIVERILADYRTLAAEPPSLNNLVRLLDTFAKAGWPEALRLVWRLDEVFR